MIAEIPTLSRHERAGIRRFLGRVLRRGMPVRHAALFGSKARGDFDTVSDVDILLVCAVHPDDRDDIAERAAHHADRVRQDTGIVLEPWAVAAADLDAGCRTPMLVDALADGIPLWPPGAPPLRVAFTPADARFCAGCLLDWVAAGGDVCRDALAAGRPHLAAQRARDDITRLATAALLLTGDTRHRRITSLHRFALRFVETGRVSRRVLPALSWARAAYPADGGRGSERPPATGAAVRSVYRGIRLVETMEAEIVPWVLDRQAAPPRRHGAVG